MGVDSASHAGALSVGGDTFAILGGGCDICYPKSSHNIYENILNGHGGIISENIPGTLPMRQFFPLRNRIISGLSRILVVVEARERSGSLITADCALDQGIDIYAVPGRYGDDLSKGTNHLIEQGAGILYDVDCFLKNTGIVSDSKKKRQKSKQLPLEKEESLVYSVLCLSPKYINLIVEETGLDLLTSLHALGSLVKKGLAQETFQNYFCRKL
ncbi:MAG: DNA-protecting protein DprA, partial [Clostridiales bacterium]|nr:DNA-protecting protein DprA [Clostridiales bacterium]